MEYDFTSLMDRRGWDALAVDLPGSGLDDSPLASIKAQEGLDPIPMWVADMNFPVLPAIQEAIIRRVNHPAFGYFLPRQEYFDAIIGWHERRHQITGLAPEHIGYENGVLGGVSSILRAVCGPGAPVLLHSPTYIGFSHVLEDNGWRGVLSPLVPDEAGVWRMDYADMEDKLRREHIHAAILCSPHNPTGRVWERWELERAMELFQRYDVTVISDEIWSDLVLPGQTHIPTQSLSQDARRRAAALYAPSKTFSLAGLVGSYHIIYDAALRDRVDHQSALTHYNSQNVLSMYGLIAAYSPEGEEWLDQLRAVLAGNLTFAVDYIDRHFPGVTASCPQGTYMLFLDCTGWCAAHGISLDDLLAAGYRAGVVWQDGRPFHGPCHIRMNLALPRSRVEEAFRRLAQYVFTG